MPWPAAASPSASGKFPAGVAYKSPREPRDPAPPGGRKPAEMTNFGPGSQENKRINR